MKYTLDLFLFVLFFMISVFEFYVRVRFGRSFIHAFFHLTLSPARLTYIYEIISPLDTIYKSQAMKPELQNRLVFGTRSFASEHTKKAEYFSRLFPPPIWYIMYSVHTKSKPNFFSCAVVNSQRARILCTCAINTHSSIISRARLRVSIA